MKIYLKVGLLLAAIFSLNACGGGEGDYSYYSYEPYADSPYKSTRDLPEGLYITYRYPFTRINQLTVRAKKNCVASSTTDCIVYSGAPEWADAEKYHVTGLEQTFYRLSDLTNNIYNVKITTMI